MFHTPAHKQTDPAKQAGQVSPASNFEAAFAKTPVVGTFAGLPVLALSPAKPFDTLAFIMAYEDGATDWDETIDGFQHLIDSGVVWTLQGSYGRMAARLIEDGECNPA